MKNKKSQISVLATIIIVVAAGLILGTFVYTKIAEPAKSRFDIQACATNVIWSDKTDEFVPLNSCFTDTHNELDVETQNQAFKEIGDMIHNCWFQFGNKNPWRVLASRQPICFICSTFEMTNQIGTLSTDNFLGWLSKQDSSYKEFIYSSLIEKEDAKIILVKRVEKEGGKALPTQEKLFQPETNYATVLWHIPDPYLWFGKTQNYVVLTKMSSNIKQNLDCSIVYYIPPS